MLIQNVYFKVKDLKSLAESHIMAEISSEDFISKKLTQKLLQQLQDPLVVSSRGLPDWCDYLMYKHPQLFSFETRQLYFQATAFGTSRAIVWLQDQRDKAFEQIRSGIRRDELHEYRIGRIKHERVKVPRNDSLLDWAIQVMEFHAGRKSILEIEFEGEEGTGLGPTLEFYALVAAEMQRKTLGLWVCDDNIQDATHKQILTDVDLGRGLKPAGYYVQQPCGLFPAPLPQNCEHLESAIKLFRCLGILVAKALQDNRLVDVPLSQAFLKLLCVAADTDSNFLVADNNFAEWDRIYNKVGFI